MSALTLDKRRYAIRFALTYLIIAAVIVAVMLTIEKFTQKPFQSSSLGLLLPFFSAMMVGENFLKRYKRPPDDEEKKALINMSFIITLLFNIPLTALILLVPTSEDVKMLNDPTFQKVLLFAVPILLLIIYLMLRLAYGWQLQRQYKMMKKRGKI